MTDSAIFKLSRIYAQGWNAANKLGAAELADMDLSQVTSLNPYVSELERTRWNEGFTDARGKKA